eukprot:Pgem_evm1s5671
MVKQNIVITASAFIAALLFGTSEVSSLSVAYENLMCKVCGHTVFTNYSVGVIGGQQQFAPCTITTVEKEKFEDRKNAWTWPRRFMVDGASFEFNSYQDLQVR